MSLKRFYPTLHEFEPQVILKQALLRAQEKGQPHPTVILFLANRPEKFTGRLEDVSEGVALLSVGSAHQLIDVRSVVSVTVETKLEA